MFALELTPELWILSCPHKTEILYHADIATILSFLDLQPGHRVLESGTGSGVLSTHLATSVAPTGMLYTFEYHAERKKAAEDNFIMLGLDKNVEIQERDVVGLGFPEELKNIDCVFLDLPSPWVVVPTLQRNLAHNSLFCSFSPCIEQVQRTCLSLAESGFVNIVTIECLLKPYEVQRMVPFQNLEDEVNSFETGDGVRNKKKRKVEEMDKETGDEISKKKDSQVMIKPQSTMRGHTGYLTFARYYTK